MDNAAFLAAFSKLHEQQSGVDFEYWNEVKDGAVFYHDNDADGDGFHQPDISLPKDLLPGAIFRSFGKEMKVSGYEKKRPSPLGGCEAVLIDFSYAGEKIDGDDSHFYRSLNWYGRGLSTLGQQIVEFEDKADQKGRVMEESHLQRVIRPQAKAPEK